LDAEHANPTFDGNAAPTEPRVRLWFGKLGSSSNANSDRPRHRVTVNGELAIRPLLAGQRPSRPNATGSIVDRRSSTLFGLWGRRVADIQTTAAIGWLFWGDGGR